MYIVHPSTRPALSPVEQECLDWYEGRTRRPSEPFDPTDLVHLARTQWPQHPLLAEAFARCTEAWPESELYTQFVPPQHMRERWKYAGNSALQHPQWGELLVDLIHDDAVPGGIAIGGIEYLTRVMDPKRYE